MIPPSDTELDLLKLFWRDGQMSAREVQDRAGPDLAWAYSTTRTVLERMRAKGLLTRRSVHGMAVYSAATGKVQVLGGMLSKLRHVFEIDGPLPAAAFTGSQILDAEDIAQLEALLNDHGKENEEERS